MLKESIGSYLAC